MSALRQRGITLLEIMIALSLGAFMLVGVISLMATVSTTRTEISRNSEQVENGRYAVQILNDDVTLAGFYGPYFKVNPTRSNPSPCNDDSTLNDLGLIYDNVTPTLPTGVAGIPSGGTMPACVANPRKTPGTTTVDAEVLIVRHVNPEPVAAGSAVNGVPYMQVSFCSTENEFVFSNATADLDLTDKDCSTVQPVWSYESRAYYVAECNDCTNGGDGIPTLKAVEFSNGVLNPANPIALVEGVEDMHVEYGLDLDSSPDGVPDCYVADPTVDAAPGSGCTVTTAWSADDATNFSNVVAIDVWLLIRSVDPFPGWTDTKTYDMGRANRSGPFNDAYKRKVLKTSIMLPNVAGYRE